MLSCLIDDCGSECMLPSYTKVSQVTRVDFDGSDGGGAEVVVAQAPIRIVGAGDSVCVPTAPR
jgi:hypothetical protein